MNFDTILHYLRDGYSVNRMDWAPGRALLLLKFEGEAAEVFVDFEGRTTKPYVLTPEDAFATDWVVMR